MAPTNRQGTNRSVSSKISPWKVIRLIVATLVMAGFLLALTDFRNDIPESIGHVLAHLQFVPAVQSVLAGVVVPSLFILVGLVVATLLFGRLYCSFICPLGIFQDILIWFSNKIRGKSFKGFRYAKPIKGVRTGILALVVLSFAFGLGTFVLTWLDPYSQFARMVNMFVRPSLAEANNALVGVGGDVLFPVAPLWPHVGWALIPVLILLAIIVIMAMKKGRLYCNTICPVGATLGILSRFSVFKLSFDRSACVKCGRCLKACRSQCIDLRNGTIDHSRCVNCFDCASACGERGISYKFSWGSKKSLPPSNPSNPSKPSSSEPASCKARTQAQPPSSCNEVNMIPSSSRRAFMGLTLAGLATSIASAAERKTGTPADKATPMSPRAITPAGSGSVARFLDACTACHLCLEACPTKCLRPAYMEYGVTGIMKPHLAFDGAFCNFDCTACADVCPSGAILPIALADKKKTRIAKAKFLRKKCIAALDKTDCGACSEHCPTKALDMTSLVQPQWDSESCSLCKKCLKICPVDAIKWKADPTGNSEGSITIDYQKCIGCGKCARRCHNEALVMKPAQWDIRVPILDVNYCIGCGACEAACPVKAVVVSGIPVHEQAKVKEKEKAVDPNEGKDFAF